MTIETKVKEYAYEHGADIAAVAPAGQYPEFVREVRERLAGRECRIEDYLLGGRRDPF
jgi:hypothetical protein